MGRRGVVVVTAIEDRPILQEDRIATRVAMPKCVKDFGQGKVLGADCRKRKPV